MKVLAWPARSNADQNPYQKLLYDAVSADHDVQVFEFSPFKPFFGPSYDVLHIHWPDAFLAAGVGPKFWLRLAYLRMMATAVRLRGARLVWTAHNIQRDKQRNTVHMRRWFWPWFLRRLDGIIFMNEASLRQAKTTWPHVSEADTIIIPHGHYGPITSKAKSSHVKQLREGDSTLQCIFFGSITSYKNVWSVVRGFMQIPPGKVRLSICGKMSLREPDVKLQTMVENMDEGFRKHLQYDERFIPESELLSKLADADLAIFPYQDVFNSGAAIFALSCNLPILVSKASAFMELRSQVGSEWVIPIEEELDGEQLLRALENARRLRSAGKVPDLSALEWARIGASTKEFYEAVVK